MFISPLRGLVHTDLYFFSDALYVRLFQQSCIQEPLFHLENRVLTLFSFQLFGSPVFGVVIGGGVGKKTHKVSYEADRAFCRPGYARWQL